MTDTLTKEKTTTKDKILEPQKYKVLLMNDNFTPMEFVIALLVKVFRHSIPSAQEITMKVHNEGSGIAGIYSYEVAEQKGMEGTTLARQHGHPLVLKVEVL